MRSVDRSSLVVLATILLVGCDSQTAPTGPPGSTTQPPTVTTLTLATTTSTRDSGLLDVLEPMFEEQTGIELKIVAVGTGQALEMGRRGDADVLLTHAPDAEEQFVSEGFGTERREIMYNDFVLVGPEADPAKVKGIAAITKASQQIAEAEATFVSRGDDSGTHMKEQVIWQQAGVTPAGDWYLESGSGMAATLRMASEKAGYTLTDRGSYLAQRDGLELVILSEGDPLLHNMYAVIPVNPEKHGHVRIAAARQFADFLASPEVQQTIGEFGVEEHGQPLFFPKAE